MSEEFKESAKYKAFMINLKGLCRQHGVTIHAELYDRLQVRDWDSEYDNDENCINQGSVLDETEEIVARKK